MVACKNMGVKSFYNFVAVTNVFLSGSSNCWSPVVSRERVRRIMVKKSFLGSWKIAKVKNAAVHLEIVHVFPRYKAKFENNEHAFEHISLGGGYGDGTDIRKLAYFESAINPEYADGKVSRTFLSSV